MRRRDFVSLLAPFTLALTGCAETLPSPGGGDAAGGSPDGDGATPAPKLAPPSKDAAQRFAASNNALGLELYRKVAAQPGNVALSPASISFAMTMTYAGAAKGTADEMKRTLHLTGTADETLDSAARLSSALQDPNSSVKLRIANRLFGQKDYSFRKPFLDKTRASFGAALEPVAFTSEPESARTLINGWVEKQTEQHIKDLLPMGSIDSDTRLVLVNAIYFLADWAAPFAKETTRPADFSAPGGVRAVPTMNNELSAPYADVDVDGHQLLELRYKGDQMAMTLVLPKRGVALREVESKLSSEQLDQWISALKPQRVAVALPKFKLTPKDPVSLKDALKALGMSAAFDPGKADFSGIAEEASKEPLFISDVVHKAMVVVDEKGTEAAAATAVIMATESAAMPPSISFQADRPFLFVIRDTTSGAVLFIGRVEDPSL